MTRNPNDLTDTQLDAALATLRPPPPSETLVARVRQMAPARPAASRGSLMRTRAVAAAAAIAAVAVAATLQVSPAGPPKTPVVTVTDPAGEIPVTELAVSGDVATGSSTLSEPISLAGLPLE